MKLSKKQFLVKTLVSIGVILFVIITVIGLSGVSYLLPTQPISQQSITPQSKK